MFIVRNRSKAHFLSHKTQKITLCHASTSTSTPPLLSKVRQDLKPAMQNKDTNRLNVLRGILQDVTNASKSSQPVATDVHVLALIRKRLEASKTAVESFRDSGRADLKEKEQIQIKILEEYAKEVQTVSDDEIRTRIGEALNDASMSQEVGEKINKGTIMKRLLGPGGSLEGKPVEKKTVAQMVDSALGAS